MIARLFWEAFLLTYDKSKVRNPLWKLLSFTYFIFPPRLRWSNTELACIEKLFPATIFRPLDVCFLWVSLMFILAGQYVSLWRSIEDKSKLWAQSHLSHLKVVPQSGTLAERPHWDLNSYCVVSANKYHYCKWIKLGFLERLHFTERSSSKFWGQWSNGTTEEAGICC